MDSMEERLEKLGRHFEVAEEGFRQEVVTVAKDALLPELTELKAGLNKRIDDFNVHFLDQSRRIDALREEVGGRIDALRQEFGGRVDSMLNKVREELRLLDRIQDLEKRLAVLDKLIPAKGDNHQ